MFLPFISFIFLCSFMFFLLKKIVLYPFVFVMFVTGRVYSLRMYVFVCVCRRCCCRFTSFFRVSYIIFCCFLLSPFLPILRTQLLSKHSLCLLFLRLQFCNNFYFERKTKRRARKMFARKRGVERETG